MLTRRLKAVSERYPIAAWCPGFLLELFLGWDLVPPAPPLHEFKLRLLSWSQWSKKVTKGRS